jgi:hypothetical protein
LLDERPDEAGAHLDAAARIFREMGARNEEARTLVASAELRRAAGDAGGARQLLEQACAIFDELGTRDDPRRARVILAGLEG